LADILLTHSYHLHFDAKQVQKMQPYRPLGTLFAAAALRECGYDVALFDTMLRNPEEMGEVLESANPRILVIYEDDFNFLTKMCLSRMREIVWKFTSLARDRSIPVVVHGSDATDHPEVFFENGIDYLLRGEAESTLVALCDAIVSNTATEHIAGLVRRSPQGRTIYPNQARASNSTWSRLPRPALDLTDLAQYRKEWLAAHGYFSVNIVASRGCPYRCNWCAKPISGDKFQLRSASEVAEEMRLLKSAAGVQHIWFSDDVFALDHNWVEEFAREVSARHAAVPFKIQSRANLMTSQVVGWLKTAGCTEVWMGVESGSQKVLDAMDKGITLSQIREARNRLREADIRACYFLQFGYPGEHWSEIQETIALVRTTRPDDVGISFSYPLPGTVFYERVKAQLGAKRNWIASDDLCILFQAEYSTEFYRAVRDALHAEVASWNEGTPHAMEAVGLLWQRVQVLEAAERENVKTRRGDVPINSFDFVNTDELTGTEA
jgi:anaerobic magnesium-protoporphyrin IX monomethyl ester cyclase